MLGLYVLIFSRVLPPGASQPRRGDLFVVYLASGFLPWGAFVECIARGTQALVGNSQYLKKMPIPEVVFVAQSAVSATLGMLIALALVALTAPLLGAEPHAAWLMLPLVAALWQMLGFGLAMLLSTLNVFFRDTAQIVGVLLQIWMWSLPVVYVEEFLPQWYRDLLVFNPSYPYLVSIRMLLLDARLPDLPVWLSMGAWAASATCLGLLLLSRTRGEIRDVL
jgi:ABC-type polysaccharide/polyol phosphate export permease